MSYNKTYEPIRGEVPQADYELIDADPHFNRVVSFFRPSDYGVWAGSAVGFPLALQAWERLEPHGGAFTKPGKVGGGPLRVATVIGFLGGFYMAYIRSSKRFLGWTENSREVQKDRYQVKKLLSQEKLPYGDDNTVLTERLQDVANRNSQYSFTMLALLPWFNIVNHSYHGVNMKKYYENRAGEEQWGFNNLTPYDQIRAKHAKQLEKIIE